jgi:pyruvate/2-oxoglutarate dehydrogenase complex dihydrolipoamide dehydrogenase (E3) component
MTATYDAIIIGTGQASSGLAKTFARNDEKVAVLEGDKLGGTCLNYGCRPTKALRASARVAHLARHAAKYGVHTGPVTVDFAAVMARKEEIVGKMQTGFTDWLTHMENVEVIREYGHFVGRENGHIQVQAGEQVLNGKRVYINTGTTPAIPPIEGIHDIPYLTDRNIFDLKELPEHLLIIGGGVIGLEFGHLMLRFGSRITLIDPGPRIASREDEDISAALEKILRDEGMTILTGRKITKAERLGQHKIELTLEHDGRGEIISGSHLLIATGRAPNTANLNLASVGVKTDERGFIPVNDHFETGVPNIWAVGDINKRGAFTHTAYQDYEIVADNYAGGDRSVAGRITAYAMFTDPPLGRVGMTEKEARQSGKNVLMSVWQMADISRAKLESETLGLIKILVDADSEQIIGAAVLGMQGDDIIQIFSNFMHTGASYKIMQNALPIHPTVAEFIPTILGALKPLK